MLKNSLVVYSFEFYLSCDDNLSGPVCGRKVQSKGGPISLSNGFVDLYPVRFELYHCNTNNPLPHPQPTIDMKPDKVSSLYILYYFFILVLIFFFLFLLSLFRSFFLLLLFLSLVHSLSFLLFLFFLLFLLFLCFFVSLFFSFCLSVCLSVFLSFFLTFFLSSFLSFFLIFLSIFPSSYLIFLSKFFPLL